MPSRFGDDEPTPAQVIDVERPYDIYVGRTTDDLVVYRRAYFRGVKSLFRTGKYDIFADFIEIAQSNGESILVRRADVVKFCNPGVPSTEERAGPAAG